MSKIFIDRPIFAWVIAIIIMLMGIGAIVSLPVAQYPDVAPTQINIRATYPGRIRRNPRKQRHADAGAAADRASTACSISSRRRPRADRYRSASSCKRASIRTLPRSRSRTRSRRRFRACRQQVQQQGVRVSKGSPDLLLIVGIFDETDRSTNFDVSDWLTTNMQDELSRVPGVGDVNVFGSSYAMRIWLDPHKLSSFGLMPSDVITALQNQNTEIAAGEIGGLPQPRASSSTRR